ncbi:terminase small subunit [Staphylococcus phage PG-2021_76]|uniref:Terminase small subunit n=1 Tax=Mammaliicoccus phage MSShimriz1 TaxID=3230127 RepID=A0AAU8GRW8_9VIRU
MNSNNIREKIQKKKAQEEDARQAITNGFMHNIHKLMMDFSKKVDSNQIEIKDTNDLYKLYVIFSQMSQMDNNGNEGGGALPQLSSTQQQVFEDIIDNSDIDSEEAKVDLQKMAEMTEEEITQMILEKEQIMNEENSQTF